MKEFLSVSRSEAEASSCDTLSLPWYDLGPQSSQIINTPEVIESSRWTKSVMLRACKVFGINVAGFEHEILNIILRMKQKRQIQKQKQKATIKASSKGKKKQSLEPERLKWGMNYGGEK